MGRLVEIIEELRAYDSERERFEFKENWFKADELGEYISIIYSAAIAGKKFAYFVWGINDKNHVIVGTSFNCNQDVNHEPLKHYLARQFSPDIEYVFCA